MNTDPSRILTALGKTTKTTSQVAKVTGMTSAKTRGQLMKLLETGVVTRKRSAENHNVWLWTVVLQSVDKPSPSPQTSKYRRFERVGTQAPFTDAAGNSCMRIIVGIEEDSFKVIDRCAIKTSTKVTTHDQTRYISKRKYRGWLRKKGIV